MMKAAVMYQPGELPQYVDFPEPAIKNDNELIVRVKALADLQLTGSGLGAWSKQQVGQLFIEILPEMFQLAAAGKLKVETTIVKLEDIAELWDLDVNGGQRLVVTI